MAHAGVTKVSEPVGGFIRFFENDTELGFEFRVGSPSSRGAIVRTHPVGCPPKLIGRLLRFLCFRECPAEAKHNEGEQFGPGNKVAGRHARDEARRVPTPAQRISA